MFYSVNEMEEKNALCEYSEAEKCYRMSDCCGMQNALNSILIHQKVIVV